MWREIWFVYATRFMRRAGPRNDGNVSIRLPDDRILRAATAVCKDTCRLKIWLCVSDGRGKTLKGQRDATSESLML